MTTQAFELQSVTDEEVLGATGDRNLRPLWPPARRAAAKPGVEGRRDREDHWQLRDISDLMLMVE